MTPGNHVLFKKCSPPCGHCARITQIEDGKSYLLAEYHRGYSPHLDWVKIQIPFRNTTSHGIFNAKHFTEVK